MNDIKNTTLDDISQIVGFSATVRISAYYGGRNMMVPKNVSEERVLAKLIGISAARRLSAEWGGADGIPVPRLVFAEVEQRNATVLARLQAGDSPDLIAKAVGVSVRRVQQLRVGFEAQGLLPMIFRGKIAGENCPENVADI